MFRTIARWIIAFCMISHLGCPWGHYKEMKVEIMNGNGDGSVAILTHFLPQNLGFIYGTNEDCRVGKYVSGSGDTLLTRIVYRFNTSEPEGESYFQIEHGHELTLHLECITKTGNPSAIEVYCINDFDTLPDTITTNPQDVNWLWQAIATGRKLGEVTPSAGKSFTIVIPDSIAESVISTMRSSAGYIAFMLKLDDETLNANNFYSLVNYEYAIKHNKDKPYLTWLVGLI